ncbi:MAG: hypothetical protein IKM39_00960 [Clostridia bacterium]|nr:hypothetical protein [Clostridia bacterium]
MNNRRAEDFLDLYRRLETAAERLMGSSSRSSSVMNLAHHRDYRKYKEELDYARQVRNLLSHEAKINGQYGVVPGETLFRFMEKLVGRLENPPTIFQVMTPTNRLLTAQSEQRVLPLMEEMNRRGLSHVPLLKNGKVQGMFSVETVFHWILEQNAPFTEECTMEQLSPYLPLGKSYVYVAPTLLVNDARDLFDKAYDRNCQIKLLLVTKNGQADSSLMGVVSPYDLLEKE